MNTTGEDAMRREIEDLLPWHAAGTLSPRDAQRVEEALASDPELARRYDLVRDELGETVLLNESLGAPSTRAAERLFAAIDAERPVRRASAGPGMLGRIAGFLDSLSPRALAWSATAAVLAIILQAGLIASVLVGERGERGFRSASYQQSVQSEGTQALVRFVPEASAADITRFLEANKLTVVSGPSAGGLYRIRIASTRLPKADVEERLRRLQADGKVIGFIAATE
jgi:anti-sigma factor RsiW